MHSLSPQPSTFLAVPWIVVLSQVLSFPRLEIYCIIFQVHNFYSNRPMPLTRSMSPFARFFVESLNLPQVGYAHSKIIWVANYSFSLQSLHFGFSLKIYVVCKCYLRLQWPPVSLIWILLSFRILSVNDLEAFFIILLLCRFPSTLIQYMQCFFINSLISQMYRIFPQIRR